MRINSLFFFSISLLFIAGCSSSKKLNDNAYPGIRRLQFVNEYIVPNDLQFNGTTVGGLSGIDYDKARDVY
ncbi:MAG: hypothetical protein ACXWWC_02295, partial [Chitinophagaceae bacterium]